MKVRNFKKATAIVLALSLSVLGLSACQNQNTPESKGSDSSMSADISENTDASSNDETSDASKENTEATTENKSEETSRPIVVIGPMESEYAILESTLENPKETLIGPYKFVRGTISGQDVVTLRSYVGMTNAAIVTTLAIQEFNPSAVIFQGTSGGHNPEYHQGDIVLGENIINIGAYNSPHRDAGQGIEFKDWEMPGIQMKSATPGEFEDVEVLHSDAKLLEIAKSVAYDHGTVYTGTISSGDIWNKEIDRINYLHEEYGSDTEEMEGHAVAQVCYQFDVPVLGIRILSNSELHPEEEFDHIFGEYCQKFSIDVIKAIAEANQDK